ncbi:glycosyltransferase involved in cell wall biosynthesis [Methanocalculus sp. AMF5]|uniref:glycosyltransferase n=1 Tax=Methanocalculus sp. AMF5 TaxID=1198257 RepID=UPI00209DCA95|nr:glycosyltransferase [Methanocalculus sp. AMF5]MCP1662280.1 glycosyltransferase involved in cell wall biosynthesis [Methanocalculus sp. AMF5]
MQDIFNLPFDLYIRNRIISDFIALIHKDKTLTILDAGGRSGELSSFVKTNVVCILDILLPTQEKDNYILGSILNPPFRDCSFDLVILSDVLEHIEESERSNAIKAMLKLTNNYLILGGPFDSEDVRKAEALANEFFLNFSQIPHPWLSEHVENGLPSKIEFERFLNDEGYDWVCIPSNNLINWLILQHFIFSAYIYGIPTDDVASINQFYNENSIELGDYEEPSYRTIYLIGKKGTIPPFENVLITTPSDSQKQQVLISLIFKVIGELIQRKDVHIGNLDGVIRTLREQESIHNTDIIRLNSLISAKDVHIENIESELYQQQKKNVQLSDTISDSDNTIFTLSAELTAIQNSTTWIMISRCHKMVNRLMPQGTGRRRFYDLGIVALRIFVREGPIGLWVRGQTRLQRRYQMKKLNSTHPVVQLPLEIYDGNIPLLLDNTLTIKFISPINSLNSIEFLSATYERHNANLHLIIREGSFDGPIVRETIFKGRNVVNNGYTRWNFPLIPQSKGKVYFLQLISTGSPSAAVWYNPDRSHAEIKLYRDEKEICGLIGLRCYTGECIRDPFHLWIMQNEPGENELSEMQREGKCLPYMPKISIVMPVWNTDERWLRNAIDSVRYQIYENWELCIADGGSDKSHIRIILEEYANVDSRIKVTFLSGNKGISDNSNEALSLATGEFIGLLDHDDELTVFALFEIVKTLNLNSNLKYIYSDEDKIDDKGKRSDPFFKPDWSPDKFLSHNYLCHFSVIDRDVIQKVGGFRKDYDGSQDYDLFLRATELLAEVEIGHIPKILYHWRMIPGSAADTLEAKPYAIIAGAKALTDAMRRRQISASVQDGLFFGYYRVKYEIHGNPLISIIIPTKDKVDVLKTCISSILKKTDYNNYEIIIVDNQSNESETQDYYNSIKNDSKVKVINFEEKFNFSAINNYAISMARGEYIVLLNNDTEIINGEWLTAMLEHAQRDEVGAVGAKLLYYNNTIQHAGVILGLTGNPGDKGVAEHSHKHMPDSELGYFLCPHIIGNVSAVTAACMMIKKQVYEEVGGLDEDLVVAFNDVDLCLKIRSKGYTIIYTPYAQLFHYESLSRGYEDTPEKQARFIKEVQYIRKRWGMIIDEGDPYYNPNLSLNSERYDYKI